RAAPVGHRMRRIRDVLAVRRAASGRAGGTVERERPVRVEIQARGLRFGRRPCRVGPPAVRARLEGARPPGRLLAGAVQVVAEERGLDRFPELVGRLVATKRDQPDAVSDRKSTRLNSSHEWNSYA